MPMRIARLSGESIDSVAVGGLAPQVSELAVAFQRRGHDVDVFTRIGPKQPTYEKSGGVRYRRSPYRANEDSLTDNERMCYSFAWHLAKTEAFEGKSFDTVHGHDWPNVRPIMQAKNRHHNVWSPLQAQPTARAGPKPVPRIRINTNQHVLSGRTNHGSVQQEELEDKPGE